MYLARAFQILAIFNFRNVVVEQLTRTVQLNWDDLMILQYVFVSKHDLLADK